MDTLKADQQARLTALKTKLQNLGLEIKSILEQGRLVATDLTNLVLFKGMYKELKPYFDSFNAAWDQITELTIEWKVPNIFPVDKDTLLQKNVKRYYYEACGIYEQHMNPTPSAASIATSSNTSMNESRTVRARLPQINLPSFNGNQVDWPLFKDTYNSLIHEESSLSGIEKFLFLVSCLKGPALALIKGIEIRDANYEQAWKLLNDTYNDKRRLASNYLKPVLEFAPMKGRPTANALKHLLTTVIENIESLKQLKVPNGEDFILFCLILRCLDPETRRSFEKKYSDTDFPSCKNLIDFIKVEWRSLELTMDESSPLNFKPHGHYNSKPQPPNRGTRSQTTLLVDNRPSQSSNNNKRHGSSETRHQICPVCKYHHTLYQCEQFRKAAPTARIGFLKGWSGCTNCLSAKHSLKNCTSQRRCQTCAMCHHTWLHVVQAQTESSQSAIATPTTTSGVVLASHNENQNGEVLLGTAIIQIKDVNGIYTKVRAVTDSGSQHSFITATCAQKLGLHIEKSSQTVLGIGQVPLIGTIGALTCSIRTRTQTDFCVKPIVVRHITGNLPHTEFPSSLRALYASYVLADDEFWNPKPVEFLLGGDLFYEIITGRPIQVTPTAPRLLPTIFGYVVAGPSKDIPPPQASSSLIAECSEEMKPLMTRFRELEEVPRGKIVSADDRECEKHFTSTHHRLPCGRYVVSLPLMDSIHALVNPRQQALNRLQSLESKLRRDETLKGEYHEFMREYLALGHMQLAPPETSAYTTPHHSLWWDGPPWPSLPKAEWPKSNSEPSRNLPEIKVNAATALNSTDDGLTMLDWIERFSSYPKLLRSTSYALRFIDKLKRSLTTSGPITAPEYRRAEKTLLKLVQSRYKPSNSNTVNSKTLRSLRPIVDGVGLVRVGGRLRHSQLHYDAKHPYLIPADCHFTTILVDHFHRAYLHLGPTALQAMLRSRYWIVGGRGLVRRCIFHCITCYKTMHSPRIPVMGDLPSFRFEEGQAFYNVGVDFAGPFLIRESLRRKAAVGKAYLCVFVCMATKAVHLEVVSNCSTDAFLAAFSRFVARRGKPSNMYSDCGTNFIGAANQLKEIMLCLRSKEAKEKIMQHVVPQEIKWNFNPPSAPHFGGIWEAAVKSCKSILYKVMGESALTFEELSTLFCRIEGVLNSRPICANNSDPDSAECLTPGHFLIGRPLTAIPERQFPEKISPLRRWNLLQQMAQHFWARWCHEYLNILQQRQKWTKDTQNLNIGDLVIIKEPNSPMKTWPLARILHTHAGKDSVVRVVTIRTSTGVYKRPVAKLVPLDPVNEQCDYQ